MAAYEPSPDEGYSEHPMTTVGNAGLSSWIQNMPVAERADLAMKIMDNLPTSQVCEIVGRLRHRMYIDFFQYLPQEVCLKILGYLDPESLISTVLTSHSWMQLALDRKLWEHLYLLEGFRFIRAEVIAFEEALNAERSRPDDFGDQKQPNKRRALPQRSLPIANTTGDSDLEMLDVHGPPVKQRSLFGPSRMSSLEVDENMLDVSSEPFPKSPTPSSSMSRVGRPQAEIVSKSRHVSSSMSSSSSQHQVSTMFSLVTTDSNKKKRLNWQYLYSQRRRLEANWEAERYTNFQLPHPNYPQEAHKECIYTIQFAGKYLVSGSRDRTLRIWDLDTRRLVRSPLCGHTGSVLCLQFDADPEEDLIVSGSSDSTVIIWKFSTGQIVQQLKKAHRESVLNVRFDKRVLVTCSKDKMIKVFNRKPLNYGDLGYPLPAGSVHPVPTTLENYGLDFSPAAGWPTKPPYSMIGVLEGHNAAVNAVQIYGEEVVSASGDRLVKVWSWPDQSCTRTLVGHTKGIACVQYDGRRIVSGSSDNEVKIFDKESGLEVASLRTHTNLVRTVQAGFGDLPYSEDEDKANAKRIDDEYFKAVDAGTINRTLTPQRGRERNAGSWKPEDITAYGAKLPPGGGGGKFGRIVSGSYDETIIIWKRDKEGVWRALHTLRQEEAARRASRVDRQQSVSPASAISSTAISSELSMAINTASAAHPRGTEHWCRVLLSIVVPQGPAMLREALVRYPWLFGQHQRLRSMINTLPLADQQALINEVRSAFAARSQSSTGASAPPLPSLAAFNSTWANPTVLAIPSSSSPIQMTTSQSPPTAPIGATPSTNAQSLLNAPPVDLQAAATGQPVPNLHPHHPAGYNHLGHNMARVFKLQFDARRVICCSQTSVIVGWDFAHGDQQIIEASRFFAPIE